MKSPRIAAALFALALSLGLSMLLPAAAAQAAPGGAFKVLVDAGHGGSDPGALSDSPRLVEKDVTLRAALATGAALQRRGISVVYTRADDRYVALADRASMAGRVGADLLLSIHVNSAGNTGASGVEAWHGNGASSRNLAGAVLSGLAPALRANGVAVRGTYSGPTLAVLRASVPSALIEIGYASNAREAALLNSNGYLAQLAEGMADGVVRYRDGARVTTPARPSPASPLPLSGLYFVRPGDTLGTIASRVGAAAVDLVRLNPLVDPLRLLPGNPLHIPTDEAVVASWSGDSGAARSALATGAAGSGVARTPAGGVHVVQPGETLSGIALRYGLSASDLARWNGIADARRLLVGQRLLLRAGGAGATPATGAQAEGGTGRSYRVQPGDTISEIALRYGVTAEALLAANRLSDANLVVSGTNLTIPVATRA
jgi:N-acetylmuramoyl-L-alanine amidase